MKVVMFGFLIKQGYSIDYDRLKMLSLNMLSIILELNNFESDLIIITI